MTIAFLNGEYLPLEQARISPLDRGFLFGDGVYEVIPAYDGKMVGFNGHIERLANGLNEIQIQLDMDKAQWHSVLSSLIEKNGGGNLGLYIQISRGADVKRYHPYPSGVTPTLFAYAFSIPDAPSSAPEKQTGMRVACTEDLRWKRCHIKSTSLLGNVIHYQQGYSEQLDETLLYNQQGHITEFSSANVFIVKNGTVITPPLDNQILPGITRDILLSLLSKDDSFLVEQRPVTLLEAQQADEIWLTSSSREVMPVIELAGKPVGDGKPGPVWDRAVRLYAAGKYDF